MMCQKNFNIVTSIKSVTAKAQVTNFEQVLHWCNGKCLDYQINVVYLI